jgi:hypothetical protein
MKKATLIIMLLCFIIITFSCGKQETKCVFKISNGIAKDSYKMNEKYILYEYSSSGEKIDNHVVISKKNTIDTFIVNPQTNIIKVKVILRGFNDGYWKPNTYDIKDHQINIIDIKDGIGNFNEPF